MDFKPLRCSINEDEFYLFKDYIEKKSGIIIPLEKAYLIETRLSKLMLDSGAESFKKFYDFIIKDTDPNISEKIINAITINETMWFRDAAPWSVMEEVILPKLISDFLSGAKIRMRIWCAAVSTGQEAYSAAMCVDNYLNKNNVKGVNLSNFEFIATDISGSVLDIAKRGRYDKINIKRGLSDYYREKYFFNSGSVWEIDTKIKNAVKFERFNLQDSYKKFGLFDVIFCRYVLIYFSQEKQKEIAEKIHGSLYDGGVLFTGNYVLYDLLKDNFDTGHFNNLTYYLKKRVPK
ncbi:MAG: protein-glutamate O-methyltransferase CheR [Defluviitaleaceae bacterium]|nr:protein-glutamate O-methyltransferase CheR [Defluviitaleaceae bacterium]